MVTNNNESPLQKAGRLLKFLIFPYSRVQSLIPTEEDMTQYQGKRGIARRLMNPLTILGFVIITVIIFMAIFAPWISPYPYSVLLTPQPTFPQWSPPSLAHWFGTSEFGYDVFGRFVFGARSSLTIGLTAVSIAVIFGVLLGLVCGYYGGWLDNILMRVMDMLLAFPALVLALVFLLIFGHSMQNILLAFGILGIPEYARLMRGSVLAVKESVFIQAAKVSGATDSRIIFRHILMNCISPIIVNVSFDIGGMILALAGVSFLGFGNPNAVEWGNDLAITQGHVYQAPWAMIFPGLAILITVLGFMLIGDGLRDALDPRLKNL
jgi:ABC-type dipeptide/oligopeptide/nickel transport system permease subunit